MEFEWDDGKAERNLIRHGVTFTEASTVFGDLLASTFEDPDHSITEDRYTAVGMSDSGRLIVVCYTDRGERLRIISARLATRAERKAYEDTSAND
jgi:uncharacterized DUF497 family protein